MQTADAPPDLIIRPAAAADLAAVVALILLQFRDHDIPTPGSAVERALSPVLSGAKTDPDAPGVLVAQRGEALVGVAYFSFATPLEHAGPVVWLEELFVLPEHRGLGIGQRLIAAVTALAEARGCVSVDLEVDINHPDAARLYDRLGFRSLRRDHRVLRLSAWDW